MSRLGLARGKWNHEGPETRRRTKVFFVPSRPRGCFLWCWSSLQQLFQPRVARSADRQLRPVRQNRDPIVFDGELDLGQARDVENIPPMDPDEDVLVEERLELGERLLLQETFASGLHRHAGVLRLEVSDLV